MRDMRVDDVDGDLARIAKLISDLEDLVRLLKRGLASTQVWQRQLLSDLEVVDIRLQVLRMAVAMNKQDAEILEAATGVRMACRNAEAAVLGSRAAHTTKAAVKLAATLAANVERALLNRR